mgnify:CR=1 FL=1
MPNPKFVLSVEDSSVEDVLRIALAREFKASMVDRILGIRVRSFLSRSGDITLSSSLGFIDCVEGTIFVDPFYGGVYRKVRGLWHGIPVRTFNDQSPDWKQSFLLLLLTPDLPAASCQYFDPGVAEELWSNHGA